MSSYTSISAYVLAVKLRSAKTILVEGKTDKKILSRVILEHVHQSGGTPFYCIDDASMVSDSEKLSGKGNRDKVFSISEAIGKNKDRFKYLADREWEGWSFSPHPEPVELPVSDFGYLTKGHSIENYWFLESALSAYLKTAHPEHLSNHFFIALKLRFDEILRFSASFSLAMKDAQVIVKCTDLLNSTHLGWDGESYFLLDGFEADLRSRGAQCEVHELWREKHKLLRAAKAETLQWLCHGHLGEEAMRCCTAHLAAEFDTPSAIVGNIERGRREEKMGHDASHISQLPRESIDPLDKLVQWVGEST